MLLGIDLDGVVVDFTSSVNDWFYQNFGLEHLPPDSWDWFEGHGTAGSAAWKSLWTQGMDDELFLKCKPVKGAVNGLVLLLDRGHQIIFVTHRPPHTAGQTVRWLQRHGLPTNVCHLRNKGILRADFYVDDKPETVKQLLADGHRAVLFQQPWNTDDRHLPSTPSWQHLLVMIDTLSANSKNQYDSSLWPTIVRGYAD